MISQSSIEQVKDRASLVEIIGELVQLRRQGSGFVGLCPFHNEKSPSFNVRESEQYYHCFGCGASGNVFSFLMETRGLTFPEAVEELAARYGITLQYDGGKRVLVTDDKKQYTKINAMAFQFFREQLHKAPPAVIHYLKERALTREAVEEFGIGFCPADWHALSDYLLGRQVQAEFLAKAGLSRRNSKGELYDYYRGRLIFPIWTDKKNIAGFGGRTIPHLIETDTQYSAPKYLNSPDTPIYHKSKVLFGLTQANQAIRDQREVYVVEGYMDVISLWQVGVKNVVACCGTALTGDHVRRLSHLAHRVFLLFDGDNAGRAAAAKSLPLFLNSGIDVRVVLLAEGHDPDTLARAYAGQAAEALRAMESISLLECYIDNLLEKFLPAGAERPEGAPSRAQDVGAALKGRIAQEIAGILAGVKNPIEHDELLKQAAFKLGLSVEQIRNLGDKSQAASAVENISLAENLSPPASEIPEMPRLPRVDRELLHVVMGEWRFIDEVMRDGDLCLNLQPASRLFIEGLGEVYAIENIAEDERKELIKTLLKNFGPSWIAHWKQSFEMKNDPRVNLENSFRQCKQAVRKIKLNQELTRLDSERARAVSDEEKSMLLQRRIELQKALAS